MCRCVTHVPMEGVFCLMVLHLVLLLRHPVLSADTFLLSLLPPVSVLIPFLFFQLNRVLEFRF